jgi:hypothetical protein
MAAEAWQDFGQKVDLTARIREILLNYPEGTSILKELVQVRDCCGAALCTSTPRQGQGKEGWEWLGEPLVLVSKPRTHV